MAGQLISTAPPEPTLSLIGQVRKLVPAAAPRRVGEVDALSRTTRPL